MAPSRRPRRDHGGSANRQDRGFGRPRIAVRIVGRYTAGDRCRDRAPAEREPPRGARISSGAAEQPATGPSGASPCGQGSPPLSSPYCPASDRRCRRPDSARASAEDQLELYAQHPVPRAVLRPAGQQPAHCCTPDGFLFGACAKSASCASLSDRGLVEPGASAALSAAPCAAPRGQPPRRPAVPPVRGLRPGSIAGRRARSGCRADLARLHRHAPPQPRHDPCRPCRVTTIPAGDAPMVRHGPGASAFPTRRLRRDGERTPRQKLQGPAAPGSSMVGVNQVIALRAQHGDHPSMTISVGDVPLRCARSDYRAERHRQLLDEPLQARLSTRPTTVFRPGYPEC